MTLQDIENLSASELKARRSELQSAVDGPAELVKRYLDTLYTAKLRDEKLDEQGKTITALQKGNESMQKELDAVTATQEKQAKELEKLADVEKKLAFQMSRASRNQTLAARHYNAISTIAKLSADSVAAQQIEDANKEE